MDARRSIRDAASSIALSALEDDNIFGKFLEAFGE